jgi:predicted SAM-dependent methyltransferase
MFIHHDLSYGIPYKDETADFIYSSHFLEHLPKETGQKLLKEAYRVLKKEGIIRICIPDLSYAISLYNDGAKEKMMEDYFFIDDKESHFARHKYMYDFELLRAILEKAGFSNIVQCSYREGAVPDLHTLDNRPEDTLYVEGKKY